MNCKTYPLSDKETEMLDKYIDENLKKGYIWSSPSPQSSPFFFVAKKDSKELRPVIDYRKLNSWTIPNNYPLPLAQELMEKLKGAKFFTKLDI